MVTSTSGKKRVLIVDDSVFARKIASDIIASSPLLEVAGAATNGGEALVLVEKLRPDVITLDIEMPGINGLETLRRIMQNFPTPVVMLSSLTTSGANESIQALALGAVDVMAKPHGSHSMGLNNQKSELISKLLAAADARISNLQPVARNTPHHRSPVVRASPTSFPVVIIASSTGGPRALRAVIPNLPAGLGAAYVVVQHLPEGFSGPLVRDLDTLTDLNVRESSDGDSLSPGDLIFAKAGYHMIFETGGRVRITKDPPLWGVRPSADVTMLSALPVYGRRLISVVLTGMGRDGANGSKLIKEAGGMCIGEHESTCVVYGMPRATAETGCLDTVAPLPGIADAVEEAIIQTNAKVRNRAAA